MQRLKLSICPKGIETFDAITGETLHRISIYKISYCSADAAHSNVFAFIAGRPAASIHDYVGTDDTDELTCYAFICAKRKIAHSLTITVAKNFERAFELWKHTDQRKIEHKCELDRLNEGGGQTSAIKSNHHLDELNCNQSDNRRNLLIDFNSDACDDTQPDAERQRQILQTRWVSFDDEPLMNDNRNNDGNDDDDMMQPKVFANNLWDMNVICS